MLVTRKAGDKLRLKVLFVNEDEWKHALNGGCCTNRWKVQMRDGRLTAQSLEDKSIYTDIVYYEILGILKI